MSIPVDSSSTDEPPESQFSQRFSWNQAAVVVLIALAIGVGISLWHPLLLAPPYLGMTWPLYVACGLAWLPILFICLPFRPTGRRTIPIALAIIGLLIVCVTLAFVGPIAPIGAFGQPLECEVVSQTSERIRYECVADRMFMVDTYVYEGPVRLPLVWFVSQRSASN